MQATNHSCEWPIQQEAIERLLSYIALDQRGFDEFVDRATAAIGNLSPGPLETFQYLLEKTKTILITPEDLVLFDALPIDNIAWDLSHKLSEGLYHQFDNQARNFMHSYIYG